MHVYLRAGDYPKPEKEKPEEVKNHSYAAGVADFYKEAHSYIISKKSKDQFIIAMGHLHAAQAEITDMDQAERAIMGGLECIPGSAFHPDLQYVALGHIHKAQKIGGQQHIRYSGSPIPLSFSELNYRHQVLSFELTAAGIDNIKPIEVPVSVPLIRVPQKHAPLPVVIQALEELPEVSSEKPDPYPPFLEIRILLDEPQPGLRHQVEKALAGKNIRLAKIDVKYPSKNGTADSDLNMEENLGELTPEEVFNRTYAGQFQSPPPAELSQLFKQAASEAVQHQDQDQA